MKILIKESESDIKCFLYFFYCKSQNSKQKLNHIFKKKNMSLLRSEPMKYCNLILPRESAWDILNSLGELSCLQFIDQDPLSAYYSRPFSNFVRRCEDLRMKLDFIDEEARKWGKTITTCKNFEFYLQAKGRREGGSRDEEEGERGKKEEEEGGKGKGGEKREERGRREEGGRGRGEFDEVEEEVGDRKEWLGRQLEYFEEIKRRRERMKEERIVLNQFYEYVGKRKEEVGRRREEEGRMEEEGRRMEEEGIEKEGGRREEERGRRREEGGRVDYLAGVIGREEEASFSRIIWRVSKGNALTHFEEGAEEESIDFLEKVIRNNCIFFIYFRKEKNEYSSSFFLLETPLEKNL